MTGSGCLVGVSNFTCVVCLAGHLSIVEQAARAPLLCPRPVSDGQFYSPPESVAGQWRVAMATAVRRTRFNALPFFRL